MKALVITMITLACLWADSIPAHADKNRTQSANIPQHIYKDRIRSGAKHHRSIMRESTRQ